MVTSCAFPIGGKGGSGKSTLCSDLVIILAGEGRNLGEGYRTLVIDTDKQGAMYKTFTGKHISLSPRKFEDYFNQFIETMGPNREKRTNYTFSTEEPTKTIVLEPGYIEEYSGKWHAKLPEEVDVCYLPVNLINNKKGYADGFGNVKENITAKECYDFVFIDLPGYSDDIPHHVIDNHNNFTDLIPLIVTGATEHELLQGLESYIDIVETQDDSLTKKLKPVMIINRYSPEEHDYIKDHVIGDSDDTSLSIFESPEKNEPATLNPYDEYTAVASNSRRNPSITIKELGITIPVFTLPNLELSSATRQEYTLTSGSDVNTGYVSRNEMDSVDAALSCSSISISDIATESDSRYDRKQNGFHRFGDRVDIIATHISEISQATSRQLDFWGEKAEIEVIAGKYNLSKRFESF